MRRFLPIITVFGFLSFHSAPCAFGENESLDRVRTSFEEEYRRFGGYAETLIDTLLLENGGTPEADRWARFVQTGETVDADALTVHTDLYWNAYFAEGWENPKVYLIRTCLLMSEGRLDAVWNNLCFATPVAMAVDDEYFAAVAEIWQSLLMMCGYLDRLMEGYRRHLEIFKGADVLDHAIYVNSNYSPALLFKGEMLMTAAEELGDSEMKNEAEELYERARSSDPYCVPAYDYPEELRPIGKRVRGELIPVLNSLVDGEMDHDDLIVLAEGSRDIGASEFAVYALWIAIGLKRSDETQDQRVESLMRLLREMGREISSERIEALIASRQ